MKWKLGNVGGTVVSDAPYLDNRLPSPKDLEYYGGNLVAESIPHPDLARMIKATPRLLETCRSVLQGLSSGEGSVPFMVTMLESAVADAEGRLP